MERDEFDDLLRDKLGNFEQGAPDEAWDTIFGEIQEDAREKWYFRKYLQFSGGIAAILALILLSIYVMEDHMSSQKDTSTLVHNHEDRHTEKMGDEHAKDIASPHDRFDDGQNSGSKKKTTQITLKKQESLEVSRGDETQPNGHQTSTGIVSGAVSRSGDTFRNINSDKSTSEEKERPFGDAHRGNMPKEKVLRRSQDNDAIFTPYKNTNNPESIYGSGENGKEDLASENKKGYTKKNIIEDNSSTSKKKSGEEADENVAHREGSTEVPAIVRKSTVGVDVQERDTAQDDVLPSSLSTGPIEGEATVAANTVGDYMPKESLSISSKEPEGANSEGEYSAEMTSAKLDSRTAEVKGEEADENVAHREGSTEVPAIVRKSTVGVDVQERDTAQDDVLPSSLSTGPIEGEATVAANTVGDYMPKESLSISSKEPEGANSEGEYSAETTSAKLDSRTTERNNGKTNKATAETPSVERIPMNTIDKQDHGVSEEDIPLSRPFEPTLNNDGIAKNTDKEDLPTGISTDSLKLVHENSKKITQEKVQLANVPLDTELVEVGVSEHKEVSLVSKLPEEEKENIEKGSKSGFYLLAMPILSYLQVIPNKGDGLLITDIRSAKSLSMDRLGLRVELGAEYRLNDKINIRGGIVYFQRKQKLTIETASVDSVVVSTSLEGTVDFEPLLEFEEVTMDYTLKNLGGHLAAEYILKEQVWHHSFGLGLEFQKNINAIDEEFNAMGLYNLSKTYTFINLYYKLAFPVKESLEVMIQPTMNYSLYVDNSTNAPFYVKPYGFGLSLGLAYHL